MSFCGIQGKSSTAHREKIDDARIERRMMCSDIHKQALISPYIRMACGL
jgi:hypothetical protein